MKASYTKISNLCNLRLFLFLILFIVSGCQINQSVSILKEKLFSDADEVEKEDNEISKPLDIKKKEVKESSIVKKSEQNNKEVQKDQMSFELKDDKIVKDQLIPVKSRVRDIIYHKENNYLVMYLETNNALAIFKKIN